MQLRERQPRRTCAIGGQVSLGMLSKKSADCTCMRVQVSSNIWHLRSHPDLIHNAGKRKAKPILSRPVLPFCPLWLHTLICLNSPELHCWLSAHPRCIKMLGCFRVYVRRSRKPGTDPAKDSMPRACRRGQGLPNDLPKDSLCLHLVVIDCMFVVRKVFGMTLPKTACQGHAVVS